MGSSQVEMYLRHFNQRGFVSFTVIDHTVEEFMKLLEVQNVKYRLDKYKTFVAITLVGKCSKPKRKSKKRI